MHTMKRPELLAPAGNLEKLKFAVHYGANAVYIGGQQYGLRSNADNFTFAEMREAVEFAATYGARVFVAANIFAHNEDISGVDNYLSNLQDAGIAAIIVADPAIIEICRRVAPKLEIHLSTQQSTMNWQSVQFWKEDGVDRIVLAREVSFEDIRMIKSHVDIEIETFIHGAMCSSYSGRCVLSNHFTGRDSNRGGCCQSCRWKYELSSDPGNDDFSMGAKDLCMLEHVPQLIEAGIDSFKIEGRMKSAHYVATVVNVYTQAINAYMANPDDYKLQPEWLDEINKAANRPLNSGFYFKTPDHHDHIFAPEEKLTEYDFAGLVLDYDADNRTAVVQQRNHFKIGQEVEFFGAGGTLFKQALAMITDMEGQKLEVAKHAMQLVRIQVNKPLKPFDIMRKKSKASSGSIQ